MSKIPFVRIFILTAFLANTFGAAPPACAESAQQQMMSFTASDELHLPVPGVIIPLSPPFAPPLLKGIKVYPDNPFRFDFILDQGDSNPVIPASAFDPKAGIQNQEQTPYGLKTEAARLIKYFLASLTIPEQDLWVNLSPYEKERIIPPSFGLTEMGRDLLAEDYMLKQITASLIYPENEIGKKFWKRIYEESAKRFGTTNIPVNTFNKVWIVPEKAVVYENAKTGTAYIVESRLKVMLEQDYLAMSKHGVNGEWSMVNGQKQNTTTINNSPLTINQLGSQVVREIVIPELTKEVNEGKNFAQLRQVYNSLILATWYKKKIKDSILAQVYTDKNKTAGIQYISTVISAPTEAWGQAKAGIHNKDDVEAIYQRYLQAFKKGVYNYIKEEQDPATRQIIPRKYFSGGLTMEAIGRVVAVRPGWSGRTRQAIGLVVIAASLITSNLIDNGSAQNIQKTIAISRNNQAMLTTRRALLEKGIKAGAAAGAVVLAAQFLPQGLNAQVPDPVRFLKVPEISPETSPVDLMQQYNNYKKAIVKIKSEVDVKDLPKADELPLAIEKAKNKFRDDYVNKYEGEPRYVEAIKVQREVLKKIQTIKPSKDTFFAVGIEFSQTEIPNVLQSMEEVLKTFQECQIRLNNDEKDDLILYLYGPVFYLAWKGKLDWKGETYWDGTVRKVKLSDKRVNLIGMVNTATRQKYNMSWQYFDNSYQSLLKNNAPGVDWSFFEHDFTQIQKIIDADPDFTYPSEEKVQELFGKYNIDPERLRRVIQFYINYTKVKHIDQINGIYNSAKGFNGKLVLYIDDTLAGPLKSMLPENGIPVADFDQAMSVPRIPGKVRNGIFKNPTGGIDLTPANMNLQTKNNGEGINFTYSKQLGLLLAKLQNAPGFTPVIISVQPMKNLKVFLGIND